MMVHNFQDGENTSYLMVFYCAQPTCNAKAALESQVHQRGTLLIEGSSAQDIVRCSCI